MPYKKKSGMSRIKKPAKITQKEKLENTLKKAVSNQRNSKMDVDKISRKVSAELKSIERKQHIKSIKKSLKKYTK
jgi:hypothetical protein